MSIQNFTRIMPKHGHQEWLEKLGQMNELCLEAEYQMVKKGFRAAAIIYVDPQNLKTVLEKINKDRLIITPLKKIASMTGFSILGESPEIGHPFLWGSCLTRTYQDSQKFKEANLKNDHRTVGRMLGYPDCCIDYFIRTFPIDPCPIWVDLDGKVKGYPETNGMLRYFGAKIVAHFSCSPVCQATREIGKIWFKVMQDINKDLANELYKLLADPITWNSYHGVVQIETPYFVGLNNSLFLLKKPRIIIWQSKQELIKKTDSSNKKKLK